MPKLLKQALRISKEEEFTQLSELLISARQEFGIFDANASIIVTNIGWDPQTKRFVLLDAGNTFIEGELSTLFEYTSTQPFYAQLRNEISSLRENQQKMPSNQLIPIALPAVDEQKPLIRIDELQQTDTSTLKQTEQITEHNAFVTSVEALVTVAFIQPIQRDLESKSNGQAVTIDQLVQAVETSPEYLALFENGPNQDAQIASSRLALRAQIVKIVGSETSKISSKNFFQQIRQNQIENFAWIHAEVRNSQEIRGWIAAAIWGFIGQPIAKAIQYTSTVWQAPGIGGYAYIVGLVRQIPIVGTMLTLDYNFLRWYLSDFAGGIAFAGVIASLASIFKWKKWQQFALTIGATVFFEWIPSGHHGPTGPWLQGWGEAWVKAWQEYHFDKIDLRYALGGVGVYYLSEWLFDVAKSQGWSIKNGLLAMWRWAGKGKRGIIMLALAGLLAATSLMQVLPNKVIPNIFDERTQKVLDAEISAPPNSQLNNTITQSWWQPVVAQGKQIWGKIWNAIRFGGPSERGSLKIPISVRLPSNLAVFRLTNDGLIIQGSENITIRPVAN